MLHNLLHLTFPLRLMLLEESYSLNTGGYLAQGHI